MQVMLASYATIFTNMLKNVKNSTSSIGKHFHDKHSLAPKDLIKCFNEVHKQIWLPRPYEMSFIHDLRSTLNVQSDSIPAKVFN